MMVDQRVILSLLFAALATAEATLSGNTSLCEPCPLCPSDVDVHAARRLEESANAALRCTDTNAHVFVQDAHAHKNIQVFTFCYVCSPGSTEFFIYAGAALACIVCAALAAGLTMVSALNRFLALAPHVALPRCTCNIEHGKTVPVCVCVWSPDDISHHLFPVLLLCACALGEIRAHCSLFSFVTFVNGMAWCDALGLRLHRRR